VTELVRIAPEVQQALHEGGPVVALETTLIAHGFPPGVGVEVGLGAEAAVRAEGAVPATVGVVDGAVVVGLDADGLARFGDAGTTAR
jgi:pseudouridine-5'-phosphate glycosidase